MTSTSNTVNFILPNTQTPLFTAEWITCAYPVSDLYASTPRYLFYALLVLVFLTQWHSWLANVFLGVVATYAGTAAIEVFILSANRPSTEPAQTVSIPYISSSSVHGNATLSAIPNLVVNTTEILVQPAALEYDIDAVLAITVTGYLMMLPMHCWSSAVRTNRARHFLIFLWNLLMFAGMICAILLWPTMFDSPLQYRFCYPTLLDTRYVTSDGHYDGKFWLGEWNETIWHVFEDFDVAANLNQNCLYPCFNTSQILRRPSSLVAAITNVTSNPRLATALVWAGVNVDDHKVIQESYLANLMYAALVVTTVIMVVFLIFTISPARRWTRVPVQRPRELFWKARKELFHVLWQEFKQGLCTMFSTLRSPTQMWRHVSQMPRSTLKEKHKKFWRFVIDVVAIITLFVAMIITPLTIVVFIVWIEWYIHHDLVSSEAPQQVGQWGSLVSVALVLISALVLRLRYVLASRREVQKEIDEVKEHLVELEKLLDEKKTKEDDVQRRGSAQMTIV